MRGEGNVGEWEGTPEDSAVFLHLGGGLYRCIHLVEVCRAVQLRFAHTFAGMFHLNKPDIENYTCIYHMCLYTHVYTYMYQPWSPEYERNWLQAKDRDPQKSPPLSLWDS